MNTRRALRILGWTVGTIGAIAVAAVAVAHVVVATREKVPRQAGAPPGRWVRGGDAELFVTEAGPATGPAVVLIAGTAAWGGIWRATIPALAAAGFHTITIDLPPFGYSARPRSPVDYGTAAQGARLAAAIEALHAGPVTLVAHSFGARATLDAATRLGPARASLVLVDGALGVAPETRNAPLPAPARLVLASSTVREALVAATITNRRATAPLVHRLVAPDATLDPVTIAALQAPFAVDGTTAAVGEWLPQFLAEPARASDDARRRYAALDVPTMIVWGERDAVTPLAEGRAQERLFRQAVLVVIPGVGHIPAIEAPALFTKVLLDELRAWRLR